MLFIILILLTVSLFYSARSILNKELLEEEQDARRLRAQHDKLAEENLKLTNDNSILERHVQETLQLYNLTKDISKSLDDEKIFAILYEHIRKYTKINNCRFVKEITGTEKYPDNTVLALKIDKHPIGYLVAGAISEQDKDRFHILAHQFFVGMKRAYLFKQVQELAMVDSLTNTFTRRHFLEKLNEEIGRSKRLKLKFAFVMADIDFFKKFNDNYGHLVGDAVLREVSGAIKENIRQIDFMGRYGGEELSLVLSETDRQKSFYAAERIRQIVEAKELFIYDERLKATISVGVSIFPDDASIAASLIEKADEALYKAKQDGRNRVAMYQL